MQFASTKLASRLNAEEMKDILRNKAHCLYIGFPLNHKIIKALNEIRQQYIFNVGLSTYISHMLGELGKTPIQYCTLYREDGYRLPLLLNDNHSQPVQHFIAKHFQPDQLPFRVEIRNELNLDQIAICYL